MDRNTDVCAMQITTNSTGVNPEDNPQLKPGAKDSIGGENSTVPFEPMQKITGPFGASNKM